eukprot:SAG22_NODE_844_length_6872_cov_10.004577_4_plen_220_part_00
MALNVQCTAANLYRESRQHFNTDPGPVFIDSSTSDEEPSSDVHGDDLSTFAVAPRLAGESEAARLGEGVGHGACRIIADLRRAAAGALTDPGCHQKAHDKLDYDGAMVVVNPLRRTIREQALQIDKLKGDLEAKTELARKEADVLLKLLEQQVEKLKAENQTVAELVAAVRGSDKGVMYARINAFKYLWRSTRHKDPTEVNVRKAIWFLERSLIDLDDQ